jgi:hypothetical protein
MKSSTLYACIIGMLLVSTISFGEVITIGPGAYSEAEASASGSNYFVQDSNSAWIYKYTTIGGVCEWQYNIHAEAEAEELLKLNKSASATAIARTKAISPALTGIEVYVNAYVSGTGEYDGQWIYDFPDPDDATDSGFYDFDPYYGIGADTDALAIGSIDEGSGCWAYAYSKATGYVSLTE